jgi:methylated-DNA-protein-cysteine methyltransferase-like protein
MGKSGSLFNSIYEIVFCIPPGKVASYGQIGKMADPPCDPRMVGWAMASLGNLKDVPPVPWQRVVAKGGRISLPGRDGMVQRELLQREGVAFNKNGCIDMNIYGWDGMSSESED